MNGYHRNPSNQRFTRYTVYDQGHLVFTSLNLDEAEQDLRIRTDMRLAYVTNIIGIGYPRDNLPLGLILKEEQCDLKGYAITSRAIENTDRDFTHPSEQFFEKHVPVSRTHERSHYEAQAGFSNGSSLVSNHGCCDNRGNCYNRDNMHEGRRRCEMIRHFAYPARMPIQEVWQDDKSQQSRQSRQAYPTHDSPHMIYRRRFDEYQPTPESDDISVPSNYPDFQNLSNAPCPADDDETNKRNKRPTVQKQNQVQVHGTNLEAELIKLATNLSNIVTKETIDVEDVYPDIREDIQMDKDIKKMENEFVDDSESDDSDASSDNYYDEMMKIRTRKSDSDSDSDEFGDRKRRHEIGDFSDEEEDPNEIPENIPDHLKEQFKQLLDARNAITDKVQEQEEIIKKANENLNDEQFKARCRRQDEKKAKKRHEEHLSILSANKIAYLRIRSKIVKGKMKETNVPFMFNDKYCIFRYMELNELINLGSNDDVEIELETYDALYKAVEAREYETNSHGSDSDSDSESEYNPLDEVDESLVEICFDFLQFLEENFPDIVTEAKIHEELNKEINDDNEIFHRDMSKTNFEEGCDNDGSEDSGNYDRKY